MLVREDSLDREYEKHKPFKSESENLSTIIIIINLSIKENSISKKFIHLIKIIKEKKKNERTDVWIHEEIKWSSIFWGLFDASNNFALSGYTFSDQTSQKYN